MFVLLGEGSFDSNVSVSGLSVDAPQRINVPYNSTTSQSRLDNKHVAVCDMVQTPVDQLAVERNSVHRRVGRLRTADWKLAANLSGSRI